MRLIDVKRSTRALLSEVNAIRKSGDISGAITFFGLTLLRSRRHIQVQVSSTNVTVRPCTPDVSVAKACFSGEFDNAIKAAKPLQYGFIIDAGGYIGTAAIMFAKAFPDAKIVTLEPSLDNFEILRANVAPYHNIVAINKALGRSNGTTLLINRGTGEWGFSTVQDPADCASPRTLHSVAVTTIPALMKEFGAIGIDILKLDIEGAEYDLLKEPPSWLSSTRVIMAETHDRIVPGCKSIFDRATANRINMSGDGEKIISVIR
jgi:FkbM family methyltransferase